MTKTDFFGLVASVLNVPVNCLSPESTPDEISSWDSLAQVTICAALEQTLNIQFSMTDMLSIKALSDFFDLLEKHGISME